MEHNNSERALIIGLRNDDPECLRLLFDKYYTPLVRYSLKLVAKPDIAEEIVQETFIHLWENRNKVNECDSLSGYLYVAARHRCFNYLKSKIRSFTWEDNNELLDQPELITPHEKIAYDELCKIIQTATENLPDQCRIIFSLSRFSDLSNKEIAQQLGLSVKTIENQMTIALKRLHEALAKYRFFLFFILFKKNHDSFRGFLF